MTEAEWLAATDPAAMHLHLGDSSSRRKMLLFCCACGNCFWPSLIDRRSREAILTGERYADGLVGDQELRTAYEEAKCAIPHRRDRRRRRFRFAAQVASQVCLACVMSGFPSASAHSLVLTTKIRAGEDLSSADLGVHCDVLRDIFGNPFRPVTFDPAWRTDTAVSLASQMYESREFGAMPILADALQDAGCDSEDVLGHCRGPGPHVRGCWVVDLVLGKE